MPKRKVGFFKPRSFKPLAKVSAGQIRPKPQQPGIDGEVYMLCSSHVDGDIKYQEFRRRLNGVIAQASRADLAAFAKFMTG